MAIAFLGPLVGSLSRPLGGLLADKIGGAKVTFWNFIAMGAATIGVMYFVDVKDFAGFLAMFLILFVTTGIGNGSTYRMIPSIFREEKLREAKGSGEAGRRARDQGGRYRGRRRARIHRRDRRLRRISDPARLWRLDRRHRRPACGVASLPGVLRHLRGADVVVLYAQDSLRAACTEPCRSARVKYGAGIKPPPRIGVWSCRNVSESAS